MNLRDQLQDYDAELPRSWRPRPGSVIVGTVKRYDRAESAYGPRWICVLQEDESGDARYVLLVEGREPESEVPDFGSLGEPGDVAPEDRDALAADVLDVAPDALPF